LARVKKSQQHPNDVLILPYATKLQSSITSFGLNNFKTWGDEKGSDAIKETTTKPEGRRDPFT
jgi:hypothetical protein